MSTQAAGTEDTLSTTLQQRADYIPIEDLSEETASSGALFQRITKELSNRALRTIVGPRGCGKTHMMRFAWLSCRDNQAKPFAVFSSFQRYFRLEPLLSSNAGATQLFHSWVLARILISTRESAQAWSLTMEVVDKILEEQGFSLATLNALAGRLERSQPLDDKLNAFSDSLSMALFRLSMDKVLEWARSHRGNGDESHSVQGTARLFGQPHAVAT